MVDLSWKEKVVAVGRVTKVVKGGRRFSFNVIVVAGDGNGKVGFGLGKAKEVPDAVKKAANGAKRACVVVPIKEGTIPHRQLGKYGATDVLLIPAKPGTGVIAGGAVRAILEVAGIGNILTKVIGETNNHNVVRATFDALSKLNITGERSKCLEVKDEVTEA